MKVRKNDGYRKDLRITSV